MENSESIAAGCKKQVLPSQEYMLMQKKIDELSKKVKALKTENTELKKVLGNGEVSRLEDLVDTFRRNTKKSLDEIAAEVSMTDFSERTRIVTNDLVDYLSFISKELYSLVSISNTGFFAHSEELRQCEQCKEEILSILDKSSFTSSILPDKSAEMSKVLQRTLDDILNCMKEE